MLEVMQIRACTATAGSLARTVAIRPFAAVLAEVDQTSSRQSVTLEYPPQAVQAEALRDRAERVFGVRRRDQVFGESHHQVAAIEVGKGPASAPGPAVAFARVAGLAGITAAEPGGVAPVVRVVGVTGFLGARIVGVAGLLRSRVIRITGFLGARIIGIAGLLRARIVGIAGFFRSWIVRVSRFLGPWVLG